MKTVIKYLYSYLLLPLLVFIAGTLSILNAKNRKSFFKRFNITSQLQEYLESQPDKKNYVLIHCASMGEFEHIKPLIVKLSENISNAIVLTFFSPSGYEHVKKYTGVNLILYLPFDFPGQWRKFYRLLNPALIIISKHDAWPNQIWIANECKIPIFLVNASLNDKSSRIKGLARVLFNEVYKAFDHLYAVSDLDKELFENNFSDINVKTLGDTKFDQVVLRKKQSHKSILIPEEWLKNKLVLIFGSVWPEDLIHINEPIQGILTEYKFVKIIIAPHQPDEGYINEIISFFKENEITRFTENRFTKNTRVLIVDIVGILADLYKYAHIAYVGGSFKQGIHNVMEPAIYGIPVIYGPRYTNSYDAIQLLKNKGSLQIIDKNEVLKIYRQLITDTNYRNQLGENALSFALNNTGVSDKLIRQWQKYLK